MMNAMRVRLSSWALWLSMGSLVSYVALHAFQTDISQPVQTLLDLMLPVLTAFGVVNDPTMRGRLLGEGQKWYQSSAVWLALGALAAYTVKISFGLELDEPMNGLINVLLPMLTALGIVNNPACANSL